MYLSIHLIEYLSIYSIKKKNTKKTHQHHEFILASARPHAEITQFQSAAGLLGDSWRAVFPGVSPQNRRGRGFSQSPLKPTPNPWLKLEGEQPFKI